MAVRVKLLCGFIFFSVLLLILSILFVWNTWRELNTPIRASYPLTITIEAAASFNEIAQQLKSIGTITEPLYLKIYARLTHKAQKIKAGEYQIKTVLTPLQLLDFFIAGRTRQYAFTIVEGWSFRQLRSALYDTALVLEIHTKGLPAEELMETLGLPGIRPEGQFLPDTYQFPRGTSDIAFLQRAYQAMQKYLNAAWAERDENLVVKTPYEALILASIVEKETAVVQERPLIAAVFMSRLRINMHLQTDPTIIYGLGEDFDGNIRRKHLRQDTPYNTYTRNGLTPTPIAMPGRAAIDAILHPDVSKALYFVSRNDGTHQFSRTLKEHEAAVDKYQRGK